MFSGEKKPAYTQTPALWLRNPRFCYLCDPGIPTPTTEITGQIGPRFVHACKLPAEIIPDFDNSRSTGIALKKIPTNLKLVWIIFASVEYYIEAIIHTRK